MNASAENYCRMMRAGRLVVIFSVGALLLGALPSAAVGPSTAFVSGAGATRTASRGPSIPGVVAWTLVVLPDTQFYSRDHPEVFTSMTKWIAANKSNLNIQVVLHEGDITEDNVSAQWQNARKSMAQLDGRVPYILSTGNHDYYGTRRAFTGLNTVFKLSDNPLNVSPGGIVTIERVPGQLDNTYSTFTAPDGRKMLVFSLEGGPRQEVVDWANSVAAHPSFRGYTAILLTHAYLEEGRAVGGEPTAVRSDFTLLGGNRIYNPHGWNIPTDPVDVNDGEELWTKLVSRHASFELVLNGHFLDGSDKDIDGGMATARQTSTGIAGNSVHEILFNTQQLPQGGNGYLRLFEFLNDGKTVRVRTYSPFLGRWMIDSRNQFTIELRRV